MLKAAATAQMSAWVDFGMSFLVFWLTGYPGVSAASGAIAGGIFNCVLNYRWTFRASGCSPVNVMIKYAMVWLGSLLLNSYGTEMAARALAGSEWAAGGAISLPLLFTIARLSVSLAVSILWNLLLQRIFVYRANRFDQVLNRYFGRR